MKARPRSVENMVAEAMNYHFAALNMTPVERIPVLGRTGPDLTINEMKLVVDVKSRKEIPSTIFFPLVGPFSIENMTAVRMTNMDTLWDINAPYSQPPVLDFTSKLVRDYLAHMEEWTREKCTDGISCIVLHRPKMPIGASVVIIHSNNRRRLIEYARQHSFDRPR